MENKKEKRVLILIFSILSLVSAFLYISKLNLGAIQLIAFTCFILSSTANIVYAVDVNEKNKYSNDILILGIGLSIVGFLLKVIQTGLSQSWIFFAGYFVSLLAMILILLKLTKCIGRGKYITILLAVLTACNIFPFFYYNNAYLKGIYWKFYFVVQTFLFLAYIGVLLLNKGCFEDFRSKLHNYTTKIPSLKISILIVSFISAIPLCIGLTDYFENQSASISTSNSNITVSSQVDDNNSDGGTSTVSSKTDTVSNTASTSSSKNVSSGNSSNANYTSINIGDTITSKDKSIKINNATFSYDVLPDNTSGYYTHYEAKSGKVYIDIDVDITNTGKTQLSNGSGSNSIISAIADYNNGYTYTGFTVLSDDDGNSLYTYENIDPLSTKRGHCLIDCPQEVESSDKPLFVVLTVDNQKYKLVLR